MYLEAAFARAVLARAAVLPQIGEVKQDAFRQGAGWAEGCAVVKGNPVVEWRRYTEKAGRVYFVQLLAAASAYEMVKPAAQQILDTFVVPGESAPPSPGAGFASKTMNGFDVHSDADADRKQSLEKASGYLAAARKLGAGVLPGKPFDPSGPQAWLYQNGAKFEDRAKAVFGSPPEHADYDPVDRACIVKIMGENSNGYDEALWGAGARQYIAQYFGGNPPIWLDTGLRVYVQWTLRSGSKPGGKLAPEVMANAKRAVAEGKRRLDQWFDVVNWSEVTSNEQGAGELFAWQVFMRHGKGSKKYKKMLESYVQTLRDSGDPAAAREAFKGVNFDEMLQEFKSWAVDWK
jgi:hypothetical protein